MSEIWWSLGMGIIGAVLGLLGIAGAGICMSGKAFEEAVRETEAEDISRMEVLCTVFPGVNTAGDCRENSREYPGVCNACVMHDGAGVAEDGMHV